MNACRICLSTEVSKSLKDVETVDKSGLKTYIQIFMFCLGIEVSEHSTVSDRLCMKCFKKILTYYKFKTLALKSDAYLKSLEPAICIKNEIIIEKVTDDEEFSNNDIIDELYVKPDVGIKEEEEDHLNFDSDDDEVLSVIKKCKEDSQNGTKEDVPFNILEDEQNDNKEDVQNDIKKVPKKVPRKRVKGVKQVKAKREKKLRPKSKYKCPGICEECGKFVRNLAEHADTHIPKEQRRKYQCKFCDKTFMNKGSKYKHEAFKHKGKKQHCDICGKEVAELRAHKLRIHHKERMQHWCHVCGAGCLTALALESHLMIHTKDKPFECDICHARFRIKQVLNTHKSSVHDKIRRHMCQFCPKSFFKKVSLQDHLRSHADERPYKCEECDKRFITKQALRNHLSVHSDDKPHKCPHCDVRFSRMDTHTGERPYKCKDCGEDFATSTTLKKHRTKHSDNKPYQCPHCDAKFSRNSTHTDERPYKCEECGAAFRASDTLKNHRTTHSADRPYQCDHCDAKFSRHNYLYIHKRIHSNEKNYPCKYCGVAFKRSDHRSRHEFTAHQKFNPPRAPNTGKSMSDICTKLEINEGSNVSGES